MMEDYLCRACLKNDSSNLYSMLINYKQYYLPNVIFDLTGVKVSLALKRCRRFSAEALFLFAGG